MNDMNGVQSHAHAPTHAINLIRRDAMVLDILRMACDERTP